LCVGAQIYCHVWHATALCQLHSVHLHHFRMYLAQLGRTCGSRARARKLRVASTCVILIYTRGRVVAWACRASSRTSWPSSNLQPEHTPEHSRPWRAGIRVDVLASIHALNPFVAPSPPAGPAVWPCGRQRPGGLRHALGGAGGGLPGGRPVRRHLAPAGAGKAAAQLQWALAMRGRCMSQSVICAWARSCCACRTPPHCHIEAWICAPGVVSAIL
jgi:hypothetical protein